MTGPIVNTPIDLLATPQIDIANFLMISTQEVARSYVKNSLQPLEPQTMIFTNTSTEYELKITLPEGNGVTFEPDTFSLAPNTFLNVRMDFSSPEFERFELGINRLNFPVLISTPTIPTQPSGQWVRYLITPETTTSDRVITRTEDEVEPSGPGNNFEGGVYRTVYAVDTITTTTAIYDYTLEGGPTSLPKPPREGGETSTTTSPEYVFYKEFIRIPVGPTPSPGADRPTTPSTGVGGSTPETTTTVDGGVTPVGTPLAE